MSLRASSPADVCPRISFAQSRERLAEGCALNSDICGIGSFFHAAIHQWVRSDGFQERIKQFVASLKP